jgi:hypothetical protein
MSQQNNEKLNKIAEKILNQVNIDPNQKFGSIIAILMIISIILTVTRVLQECNKNKTKNMTSQDKTNTYVETIKDLSFKRGWFTRLRIKRIIRKELSSEDYNKYGIKLTETILDIGESVTDDEVTTLMEAANV